MYKAVIADDETIIRKGVSSFLAKLDPDIEIFSSAKNGLEAIELVRKINPDLLIIDINMPQLNGLQAIEEILSFNSHVQIIIISGYNEFDYAKKAIDLGVLGYLVKPFKGQEFEAIIAKAKQRLSQLNQNNVLMNKLHNSGTTDKDVMSFISSNYCHEDMSLIFVCDATGLSRTTVANIVKQKTDMTLTRYITYLRIEHAKSLLLSGEININHISQMLGYKNQHYFSKVFKSTEGVTPSKFIEQNSGS